VVDGVDLDAVDGSITTIVGPSGCGKSTLLRTVAGLEPLAGGRVEVGGLDVSSLPPERRRVGLVFQDHALFPHLRVDANVAFGVSHLARAERHRVVGDLLDLVRLPHVARRYPHELSGGEQQRIALARALAPAPAVVLLDEPFASLDMSLRDDVRAEVMAVLRERGTTAVLVTHDREEALLVGDRVAVMRDGRFTQLGTPAEVYERPADRFTAAFLGPVSFLGPDGNTAFRPHELQFVDPSEAMLTGVVRSVAYLGAVRRVEVRSADGTTAHVDVISGAAPSVGDEVAVDHHPVATGHDVAALTSDG
jgi:iron(III) transport system ATP-binding protein